AAAGRGGGEEREGGLRRGERPRALGGRRAAGARAASGGGVSQAAALRRPAPSGLVAAVVPLPDDTDALALLAAVPEARGFYWERPAAGLCPAAGAGGGRGGR